MMTNFEFDKHAPLMTWLDVQRRFREMTKGFSQLPEFINSVRCYSDGAEISLKNDSQLELHQWLASGFGNSLEDDSNNLILSIAKISYLIETVIEINERKRQSIYYPLWHDLAYFSEIPENGFAVPQTFPENLHISAFHSFKGGVGRTTALITHLSVYLEKSKKNKKILLIDADLEAPGITYWLDSVNFPSISFVRFLEVIHYPPSSKEDAIKYCAEELRKTSIDHNGHEIFVLPACINPNQPVELLDTPVLPEHLARNTKNPWCVGDAIQQLATELKAELVLIDLRAGLSELASPLLFDPRIERIIISTIAPQSVNGVSLILEKMNLLRFLINDNVAGIPTIILSLLTKDLMESSNYSNATERLNNAFPTEDGIEFIKAEFNPNLMCISDLKQALELAKNSPLANEINNWISIVSPNTVTKSSAKSLSNRNSARTEEAKSLEELCGRYIYAENGEGENLLITEPLRNLAKHYEQSIPITLSIGAKGAGKTFNFLQLCREKTWERFIRKLDFKVIDKKETLIFPFLCSKNLKDSAIGIIQKCRDNCFKKLNIDREFSDTELSSRIDKAIANNNTDWGQFWTIELLAIFNIQGSHLKNFNHFLTEKNVHLIILIDGLEDQFTSLVEKPTQRIALESLLRLPNRIKEIRDSHLGIIEFVRSDYVRAVIQQNAGQFEDRYKAFALEWTAESFLRLAYWICTETGLSWAKKEETQILSSTELLNKLYQLWGQKLGSQKSKEALTARWVFTVLCDLNGRLQARDLVRFLYYAAQKSRSSQFPTRLDDRVLLPEAIRNAVKDCSHKKVQEAIEEIAILKQWNEKLNLITSAEKSVPFDAQKMGLTPELTKALQDLGIIYEERDKNNEEKRFYLPESYRVGLGFTLGITGGRPKVLALIQRNFKIPF